MFTQTKKFKLNLLFGLLVLISMGLATSTALAQTNTNTLTDADIESLLYMREEEKLAHDVYVTLYDQWGANVFSNIANSEQGHMTAVLNLLNQYGLNDPAAGNAVGVFNNPELQALYDTLVAQGSQSYADALLVGGMIEEVDIVDLQRELDATSVTAIQQVYQRLLAASGNHLQAFANAYENATGESYTPQLLSDNELAAILNGGGNGNGNGRGNGNGHGHGNGQGQGQQGQGQQQTQPQNQIKDSGNAGNCNNCLT